MNKQEEDPKICERKIIGTIVSPNISENGQRRLKTNAEVGEKLNGKNIVNALRLEWLVYLMRRDPTEII